MTTDPTTPVPVVAVDVRTVSTHPLADLWEFGAVRREADGTHSTMQVLLAEPDLRYSDREVLDRGGFYNRHPDAPALSSPSMWSTNYASRRTFARRVATFTHDCVVVSIDAPDVMPRLDRLIRSQGLVPGWRSRLVDVVALAAGRGIALNPDLAGEWGPASQWSPTLASEVLACRLPAAQEIGARDTARWALRLYDAALGQDNPAEGRQTS